MIAMLTVDGLTFRDLDHDGVLAPYEDWRLTPEVRVDDLLSRMTLAEKAGTLVHGTAPAIGSPLASIGRGTAYDLDGIADLIFKGGVTSMISRLSLDPVEVASQNNAIQAIAAKGRLGIPVLLSTDPRHHVGGRVGASIAAQGFSAFPETLGLAATGDRGLVKRFGEIVNQEYRAVGLRMALSPQADLATSPRWPRTDGTFGENPKVVRALTGAYIEGIQGGRSGVDRTSVAAVVKHWVGYGASRDGFDGHNWYGRYSAFPSDALDDHIEGFLDAFTFRVASVMPTYNILQGAYVNGIALEDVGTGFSRPVLQDLLRGTYAFDGMILSDWGVTRPMSESCRTGIPKQTPQFIAMPWGVEELTNPERFARAINSGVDQIGGENDATPILQAIEAGLLTVERVNEAARRVLLNHFRLGLFDDPVVDVNKVDELVGSSMEEGRVALRASITRLTGPVGALLTEQDVVFVNGSAEGLSDEAFRSAGIATTPRLAEATCAVVQVSAPHQLLHPDFFFGNMQHEGDLDFPDDHPDLERVRAASASVGRDRTIVIAHLDRPALLGPIVDQAGAVLAEYGTSADAVVDVLLGRAEAKGKLPFRILRSMEDVLRQPCDRPDESITPLFEAG